MPEHRHIISEDRYLMGELRSLLSRWGDWHERFRHINGLPPQAAFMNLSGSAPAGHRILIPSMPKRVYFIEQAILRLDDRYKGALTVWYGYQRSDDGRWLSAQEKAQALQISFGTLSARVHRARRKLLQLHNIWSI